MTDNALVVSNGNGPALAHYQGREEVRELGDRLMKMHPAANEVGPDAMRAAAQLALLLGANPLPGANELHVWKDKDGRVCMSLGINYWRRKAGEWGDVLYQVQPRLIRPNEATEYGVPNGVMAAICKGARAADMIRYRGLGFTTNEVWDMCGRTGIGTVGANEYPKKGKPLSWSALKRAETDLLRQLFPAQFAGAEQHMMATDAPIVVTSLSDGDDFIEGELTDGETVIEVTEDTAPPRPPITLAIANAELFGDTPSTRGNGNPPATNGNGSQTPEPPTDPGPLADDEQVIFETEAAGFVNNAAALLETDADTLKARMKALGYERIPGKPAERVAAYRRLRADMGAADDIMQPALVTVEPATRPGAEYQD